MYLNVHGCTNARIFGTSGRNYGSQRDPFHLRLENSNTLTGPVLLRPGRSRSGRALQKVET